jgi:CRP-like cAMP-binding protein
LLVATSRTDLTDMLASLSLFADLTPSELESVAHIIEERRFSDGERVLRQGLSGSGFYVILDGEATIRVDGKDYGTLGRGDFFGEISVLVDAPPTADVTAVTLLRCLVIPRPDVERFLLARPRVMLRMLRSEANRLRGMLEA